MTLQGRFALLLVFIATIPLLLLVTGLVYYRLSVSESQIREITNSPPFVIRDLHRIIDGTITPEKIDSRILIVLYNEGVPVYISPRMVQFAEDKYYGGPIDRKNRNEGLDLIASYNDESRNTKIAGSWFTYRGVMGLVFFNSSPEQLLSLMVRPPLILLTLLYIIVIMVPLLLSSRFLIYLRRSLGNLEVSAGRISSGDFDTPLEIPTNPELTPVFEAIDDMRHQLKEDRSRQTRFLMFASHDLKTPLTSILGFIEALEMGMPMNEDQRKRYYRIIREKTGLLEDRISELIESTKVKTDGFRDRFIVMKAAPFVESLVGRFAVEAEAQSVNFEARVKIPSNCRLRGDAKMLTRAVENLLDNAIRYSGEGARILFAAEFVDSRLRLFVEDSGPGISNVDSEHLFESFYRGDKSRNSRGIGLGLSSTKSIVEIHGGSVGLIESRLGGAGLSIELPGFLIH